MIRILTDKAACGGKTIRIVPMGNDFRKILAEWQVLGRVGDKGGIFIATDEPHLFQKEQPVPEEVLSALSNGATLVRVEGTDYGYGVNSIHYVNATKVVPEDQIDYSFDAGGKPETAQIYKEEVVFHSGLRPEQFGEIKEEAQFYL